MAIYVNLAGDLKYIPSLIPDGYKELHDGPAGQQRSCVSPPV